ncbi:globin domain-containing protein [Streptomyces sp. CH8.1]|uniref:globin domain-containing protein n=1 Tax=Streptomyces TaxID=1883 RepID=UPI0004BD0607|nr:MULTISPECIES: globin domain-containing protein [Streptomyces]KOU20738.1 hemin transporter [Streptomyces sp. WM6349]KOU80163.1 hemin transporter [Streptomyces sp. XY593]KOU92210.1 hemin transporter [Streptomyces sp. XY533]KOV47192.1 hemin transporter [Streptomyces sp. H036]MCI4083686.1 FAD-binding oxidoreductase [Streptomyces sp. MMS21 TC-5]
MLSEQSTATVRATLPAVGAAIGDITELFYAKLFEAHPELLRDLFNRGNQNAGLQKQALAGSIAAFATHLVERPDTRPDVMLGRIAHKHASLGVTREQYTVVHRHLFAAIAEILGEAVTPEVARAWDEVYWLMANALVAIEERLYAGHRIAAGDVWREWTVTGRSEETADCATFRIAPADGAPAPAHLPGQYVSVQVELPDGARQIRQYSLSSAPGSTVRAITVKRVHGPAAAGPDGEVSNHLHAHVRPGHTLRVSAPYGDLVLQDSDAPVLLASAGIGCTPMLSMLEHLAETGHAAPVTVLHADRSPADHPLRADHRALTHKLADASARFWYEEDAEPGDSTGLMDLTDVPATPGTRAYLCGPLPFMRSVREQLIAKGVPASDIHYEVFGPDLWLASA